MNYPTCATNLFWSFIHNQLFITNCTSCWIVFGLYLYKFQNREFAIQIFHLYGFIPALLQYKYCISPKLQLHKNESKLLFL
jgi:hypothetical protein